MTDNKENIRIVNPESILLMVVLALGLIIYHNSYNNYQDNKKNSIASENIFSQNTATICPGVRLIAFQKILFCDKNNFRLLCRVKNQFLENRKADRKISLLQDIRENTERIPISFFLYHLFPSEKDEFPHLG